MKKIDLILVCTALLAGCTLMSAEAQDASIKHHQDIGICLGKGGLNNYAFWGPVGSSCNGLIEWGTYEKTSPEKVKEFCSCKSNRPNINGVTFWGPKGEACTGWVGSGMYVAGCKSLESTAIASCVGRGGLAGHRLYGPKGASCGGFDSWGVYE